MTRVTSQKVRQAVLTAGDPLDPDILPEKLMLFDEAGNPLSLGGAGYLRLTSTKTTSVLTSGQVASADLDLDAGSVRIWKIATNRPARIRVYPTSLQRDADASRGVGNKPSVSAGRLLEVVTTATMLSLFMSPAVDMTTDDLDDPFYASITNLDSGSGAVAVTYYYFKTE